MNPVPCHDYDDSEWVGEGGNSVPKHGNSADGITHFQGCYAEHPECAKELRRAIRTGVLVACEVLTERDGPDTVEVAIRKAETHIYRQLGLSHDG